MTDDTRHKETGDAGLARNPVIVAAAVGALAAIVAAVITKCEWDPSQPPIVECPEGFKRVEGVRNMCEAAFRGCMPEFRAARACGLAGGPGEGTAEVMVLPAPWEVKNVEYSKVRAGFYSKLERNVILCKAHGSTPDCGGSGRDNSNHPSDEVDWVATIVVPSGR